MTAQMARTRALEHGTLNDMQNMLEQQILSMRSFELAGDLRNAATIHPNVGYAYAELDLYKKSEKVLRTSLENAQKFGLQHAVANALHNLKLTLTRLKHLEEAERIK